jgi:tripartite-type tricarboxylate transporter receptor subunit TctC
LVATLNRQINEYIKSPEGIKRFHDAGAEVIGGTPEYLDQVVKKDMAKWEPIIKSIGIRLD